MQQIWWMLLGVFKHWQHQLWHTWLPDKWGMVSWTAFCWSTLWWTWIWQKSLRWDTRSSHANIRWWFRNPAITSWYGKYAISFTGFYTSKTVVLWDFFHQHVACELLFLPCYIPGKSKSSWHFSFQESASGSSCSESFVSRGHGSLVTCMNSNKHPKCSIYGIFSLQLASIYGKCR